ncbi:MAG: hypothetical protein IT232_09240 [Flavobacteriales bacterium]|nr:hypothetical protein [Flavobacteriales bacterium]
MCKYKFFWSFVILLFINTEAFTQATTNSPYSRFGIGVMHHETTNFNFASAGTGIGLRSFNNINTLNPASYSEIAITSLEFSAINSALKITDGKQTQFQNNFFFNHIAFGFPVIKNKWGMVFGATPYSHLGYDYSTIKTDTVAGGVSYYYSGLGGLSKVFFGNSLKFNIDSTSLISVGHNLEFIFGNLYYDKKVIFGSIANAYNLWTINNNHVADFNSVFGLQYQKKITNSKSEKTILTVGFTYSLPSDLKTKKSETIRTFTGNIDYGAIKDTLEVTENVEDITKIPSIFGGGFSLEKENKWLVGLDVRTTKWSAIPSVLSDVVLKDNITASACFEITPDASTFKNYLKRIRYKMGLKYSTAYFSVDNQDINEYGITFGLGLPLKRTDTSVPTINVGVEFGKRGTTTNGLIEESYINTFLGLTINDRWFIKRKYD